MTKLTPEYEGLRPYETNRYRVLNEYGGTLGFVSRHFVDGASKWCIWTDDGMFSECKNRKTGVQILEECRQ